MTKGRAVELCHAIDQYLCAGNPIWNTGQIHDAMGMAVEALKQPEQKWVLCSERLPEDDVEVFIYLFERSAPYIAWVEDCRWYTEDFEVKKENYPTAWMPLPEPYQEDTP